MHKSTNIGMEPVVKPGERALTRGRLTSADHGYFHLPGLRAPSGLLVGAQSGIGITADWGGGHVASADGMRFTVPVRSIHTRPNPKYFSTGRGMTWLNVVSDRFMGLGGLVMPGTLRDSLGILDAVFNLDGPVRLQFIDSEVYRRMIGVQLNIGEGRHALGRAMFFGRLGEIRHAYRDGMENQLGALGMAINAVVFWNSLYMDAVVKELEAGGLTVSPRSAPGSPR